jgi:DNA-binding HxlR family transcriptional regulator
MISSKAYQELIKNYMKYNGCPVSATIKIIGGKWKPIILYLISHDVNRFSEMQKMIEGISKKMLTSQLRELERDGLIHRKVFAEVPPRVEYTITEKGVTLKPLIINMREWGLKNVLS